ncbi:uncharacterized protein LOC133480487 [Phyllopteryx taeniolatus]|uniref:uncharacterized protein LOC133480487 n=1 Tax=Phyllopteryx taeniolatus TaxID=161469 RepID=UPI002AD3EB64|nr:uncharacterized protein LOC133480487 [Phyllopteryx taeniolatus]
MNMGIEQPRENSRSTNPRFASGGSRKTSFAESRRRSGVSAETWRGGPGWKTNSSNGLAGRSVSPLTIRLRAITLAEEMKIQHFRFMKRRHLSLRARTTVARQLPMDYKEQLAIFRCDCSKKMADKRIRPDHITDTDEVPLTFDIPVNRTVEKKGTATVAIRTTGHEKSAFTVVLGCRGIGQKLLPMVMFKRKTPPQEKFPAEVIVQANQKGRMDEGKMREWLSEVYVKRPDGFFPRVTVPVDL